MRLGLGLAILIVLLDQASKIWIVGSVMNPPRIIEVTSFFNIVMAWNRGVSFGLFSSDSPWNAYLLIGLSLAITLGLGLWLKRAETLFLRLALGSIIGGALGNVIDRLRWGAVADFLDFHAAGYHWPAFNLADSAITVGAALLIADSLFHRPDSSKTKA